MMLRVAKELNLPVTALAETPAHWIGAAMLAMEWERIERERAMKTSSASMTPAAHTSHKGGVS